MELYSFDKEDRKIKPHPEESMIARKIIDWFLEGEPYKVICDRLNSMGYRARSGGLWDISNIKIIAHSPLMRGHIMQKLKEDYIEIKDSHEAIMTDAEYYKIQQILQDRADNYKNLSRSPQHYLQGLLKCGCCGKYFCSISNQNPFTPNSSSH